MQNILTIFAISSVFFLFFKKKKKHTIEAAKPKPVKIKIAYALVADTVNIPFKVSRIPNVLIVRIKFFTNPTLPL